MSGKYETIARLIEICQSTALLSPERASNTGSFLVVDNAFRGVAAFEERARAGCKVKLFEIKKIPLFEQAHLLQAATATEHRGAFYVVWRTRLD